MTSFFLILVGGLILASLLHTQSVYNLFTVFAAPYFFIVLLNQFIASPRFGFFLISDDTLLMLLEGLIAFFVGSIPFSKFNQSLGQLSFDEKAKLYNMKAMSAFIFVMGVICFLFSLLTLIRQGVSLDQFDETTSSLSGGLLSHLKLVGLSVVPITMYYGIRQRNFIALSGTALIFVSVFLSFTKYNIICPVAASIIFIGLSSQKAERRTIAALLIIPISLFIINYVVGFALRGTSSNVSSSFYGNHLWTYLGGSLIYDNYIFSVGIRVGQGTLDKVLIFLFAFPNMIINRLFGIRFFEHQKQPHLPISHGIERANVVDAIGYLYPSQGKIVDIMVFIVVMLYIGFIFSILVRIMLHHAKNRFNTTLPFFLAEFVLMSFFGTFYINPGPWEQLIYCALVPSLFLNRKLISEHMQGTIGPVSEAKRCSPPVYERLNDA